MRSGLYNFLDNLISTTLILVIGLTPLLFLGLTTDFYDIPKLILLVVTTIILLGLWIFSWVIRGKIVVTRTPLDLPLILLLSTILISTFLSSSRYSSIFGIFPEVHGSAVSWVAYILLYFLTVSHIKKEGRIKSLLYVMYASGGLTAIISLLSFMGLFLPFEMARGINFTPAGTSFSAIAFLLMLLPLPIVATIKSNKFMPRELAVFLLTLFTFTVVLIGSLTTHILLFLVYAVCILLLLRHMSLNNLPFIIIPAVVSVLLLMAAYLPFSGNRINEIRQEFPQEIQLPFSTSWKISVTAFRDAPFFGTGPSTFLYNFTSYKPVEFNQFDFWNFTFGTAHNEFLQFLGTLGIFGLLSLVALFGLLITFAVKQITKKHVHEVHDETHALLPALAVSILTASTLLFIHASTLVSIFITLILAAVFMMSQKHFREKVAEFSLGIKVATANNKQLDILPVIVMFLFLLAAVPVAARTYNAVLADYYHRMALVQASVDGLKTYEYLQKAEELNPFIDLYRIDMAQTNFALANALALQKGPTEEEPEGTLTEEDKQTIQTLITQAINEGRAAVLLSPRSSRNWEVLALIYRNITGVANNSLAFSLDAYGRAIQLDPFNPAFRVNVGTIYYATQNYDLAVRFFTDSINLKPDYINGYYNLALALRDKGDLENAKIVAERTVSLLQSQLSGRDSRAIPAGLREIKMQDYNTAFDLLNEIKQRIEVGSDGEAGAALQNPNLPNIDMPDLDNPPETEDLPEVEDNPDVNLPSLRSDTTSP
jgi:O-antigen ligase